MLYVAFTYDGPRQKGNGSMSFHGDKVRNEQDVIAMREQIAAHCNCRHEEVLILNWIKYDD